MFNIFVYCGGKCWSSTLHNTFMNNNFQSIHVHSNENYKTEYKTGKSIFDVIDLSCNNFDTVYIIDSYRTPIERKISSFFQNITIHIPDYMNYNI